ncbi:class A sortase [Salipaludibacillus aurantiacus]|uniref:Sortase A n=1 Tax=Salipaludibacillus aurantiacus TaxID=1601833 RepID=A0A1H9UGF2_9BACI|nr:class A sortase [Salipaludibacillus aurantiacus]SES08341.1 sortase A [Salipaludibacillus aurantiacus]
MKDGIIKITGILIVLTGLILVLWQPLNNHVISPYIIGQAQEEVLSLSYEDYERNRETLERRIETESEEELFDYGSVESLDSLSVRIDIDHEFAIGNILIPSVDVHLPILMGTNDETLKAGIGTMKADQEMGKGNYALAGHNSRNPSQLFAPIRNIEEGEEIIVTDKNNVYIYEKVSSEVVMPDRTDVINDVEGEELVTLVSCYSDDGSDRIIITGELVDVLDYENVAEFLEK